MKSALMSICIFLSLTFDAVSSSLARGPRAAFRDGYLLNSELTSQHISLTFPTWHLHGTSFEDPSGISLTRNRFGRRFRRRASWGRAAAAGLGAVIGAVAGGVSGAAIGGPAGAVAVGALWSSGGGAIGYEVAREAGLRRRRHMNRNHTDRKDGFKRLSRTLQFRGRHEPN